jgi:uncharacterized delta-60 repeat protein
MRSSTGACLSGASSTSLLGVLDTTFGTSGKYSQLLLQTDELFTSVVIRPDGRIVANGATIGGGSSNMIVAQFSSTGVFDTTFGTSGLYVDGQGEREFGQSIGLQSNGSLILGGLNGYSLGNPNAVVSRITSPGVLDTTFATAGFYKADIGGMGATDNVFSFLIDTSGNIFSGGMAASSGSTSDFFVQKFNSSGALVGGFGTAGTAKVIGNGGYSYTTKMALQTDGKILGVGKYFLGTDNMRIFRLNTAGVLDTTFGTAGSIDLDNGGNVDFASTMALLPSGSIVAAGLTYNGATNDILMMKVTSSGALDTTFGTAGKVVGGFSASDVTINDMVVDSNGRIYLGGTYNSGANYDFVVFAYKSNGTLDTSFGVNGKLIIDFFGGNDGIQAMAMTSSGKIVAVGYANNGVNRQVAIAQIK